MNANQFVNLEGTFTLMPAEVLDVIYTDSNPNLIYGIKVKALDSVPADSTTSPAVITAKPLNINSLRIPVVGEVVLLLKAPSSYAMSTRSSTDVYYLDIVSLQSSIHHNALPTVSKIYSQKIVAGGNADEYAQRGAGSHKKSDTPKIDVNFSENFSVKPLQPYVGDMLYIGRYGNSIRFSTTPKSGTFKVQPKWYGGDESAPISIIRNTKQTLNTNKTNDFVTEDFTNDDNIIVLASGQNIEFTQSSNQISAINSKGINSWKTEKWGSTPQTLISSGRIIFNSTQKEIIAFAKNGIGLSSESSIALDSKNVVSINSNKIEIGLDADQPILLGNDFLNALGSLTVSTPAGPSLPLNKSPAWPTVLQAVSKTAFVK